MYFFPTSYLVNSYSPFKIQLINDDFPKYLSAEQLLGFRASCSYLCCSANPAAAEFICFHDLSSVTVYSMKQRPGLVTFTSQDLTHHQQGRCEEKEQNNDPRGVCVVYIYSGFNCYPTLYPEHCPIPTVATVKRKKESVCILSPIRSYWETIKGLAGGFAMW